MKLNIYFKNVGQGDTILLDWDGDSESERKYALIDCTFNSEYNINSLVDHIKHHQIQEFDFVLLSHPHTDHFSGFVRFLNYCEGNNIIIRRFVHTAYFSPQFIGQVIKKDKVRNEDIEKTLKSAVLLEDDQDNLSALFRFLIDQGKLNGNGFVKRVGTLSLQGPLVQNNFFTIQPISPDENWETSRYIDMTFNSDNNSGNTVSLSANTRNNPHANYISSVLNICGVKSMWQAILCSDVNLATLKRIRNNPNIFDDLKRRKLLFVQIPHHGSGYNHDMRFWDEIFSVQTDSKNYSYAVISAGETYGHPSRKAIEYFTGKCKEVHCTNFVGGFREFYEGQNSAGDLFGPDWLSQIPGLDQSDYINKRSKASQNRDRPICGEKKVVIEMDAQGRTTCEIQDIESKDLV